MKIQFDPRFTLGNLVAIGAFIAGAAVWYATVGATVEQIKIELAATRLAVRELDARMTATETNFAVNKEQARWIIRSLERLQLDRGLQPAPVPKQD